jgi:hypothetical protein
MEANEEVIKIFRPKKWYNQNAKNLKEKKWDFLILSKMQGKSF